MRTAARETLFKIVFAGQFNSDCGESFKSAMYKGEKLTDADISYCESILKIINEHKEEFAKTLDSHSKLFPESRLFPADRSILFVALAEILYFDEVPDAVSVNEAANIASKYSSAKSASFLSGILSEIIREKGNV
ncbi:MAG: hypothetical protein K2N52_03640 [Clostridia bacterium]|nr:hypothetical protein [Clostridia bacterium]